MTIAKATTMKALCLQIYGEPTAVLKVVETALPEPGAGEIRVRVKACGLNPADWALCRGFFPLPPPRGIGLDVSGIVDAIGDGVSGFELGDPVFGVPSFRNYPTAGAAEYAIMSVFVPVPAGLSLNAAAALPMAVETAVRSVELLGMVKGQTLFVNGGGTMTGFAAVQVAILAGLKVITSAGETFAARLRDLGAMVTPYGGASA